MIIVLLFFLFVFAAQEERRFPEAVGVAGLERVWTAPCAEPGSCSR